MIILFKIYSDNIGHEYDGTNLGNGLTKYTKGLIW